MINKNELNNFILFFLWDFKDNHVKNRRMPWYGVNLFITCMFIVMIGKKKFWFRLLDLQTLALRRPTCFSKLSSLGTKSLGLPSTFEQIAHCIWCTLLIVSITNSTQGSCIIHLFWKCLTLSWSHFFLFVFGIGLKFRGYLGSSKGVMQV